MPLGPANLRSLSPTPLRVALNLNARCRKGRDIAEVASQILIGRFMMTFRAWECRHAKGTHAAQWAMTGGGSLIRMGCHPLSTVLYLKQVEALRAACGLRCRRSQQRWHRADDRTGWNRGEVRLQATSAHAKACLRLRPRQQRARYKGGQAHISLTRISSTRCDILSYRRLGSKTFGGNEPFDITHPSPRSEH
jgi:hypothetical protein